MSDTLTIVPFTEDHLDGALALSREAGWPHRRGDWDMGRALSHGFAAVDREGVCGTIFATPFGDTVATINMVIVDAALRGRGIGRRLMSAAIEAAGDRELRLVATAEGLPLYEKMGFRAFGEIRQHQGAVKARFLDSGLPDAGRVGWATPEDMAAIVALDRHAQGVERRALIEALATRGRLAVLHRDTEPVGYACLRPFGRGEVVGPVIAETLGGAKALILFALSSRDGAFVRIDTDIDAGLADCLENLGLAHAGGGIRMVRPAPEESPAPSEETSSRRWRVFALASQALG